MESKKNNEIYNIFKKITDKDDLYVPAHNNTTNVPHPQHHHGVRSPQPKIWQSQL